MRLQFTIRDVILLTALIAVVMGWWTEHRRHVALQAKHEAIVDAVERLGKYNAKEWKRGTLELPDGTILPEPDK